MKKIFFSLSIAVAIFGFTYAQNAISATPAVPTAPIKMDKTSKTVMFDHKDHASIDCVTCHHPVKRDGGQVSYKKCSSSGCHDILGRSKEPMSYYQVMHNRQPSEGHETCISCHTKQAGTDKTKRRALTACVGSGCHPAK